MSESNPYDQFIMEHIRNARNYRALAAASHHAAGINPLCGDEMNVYAELVEDRIEDVAFQCSCCGISMASASIMTDLLKSARVVDAKRWLRAFITAVGSSAEPASHGIDGGRLAILQTVQALPSRRKCAALAWLTLEAALEGRPQAISTGA
jgi:nitrogen fixation NifU-like protein